MIIDNVLNLIFTTPFRFLEYGEHKGNFYGSSTESVMDVLNSGRVCIVDIEPNVRPAGTSGLRSL